MSIFRFKHFIVKQERNPLKVGTDSMLLGALIDASGHNRALDLGAGTGVLSLMIAQKNPNVIVESIEINEHGMLECFENFESSPWTDRLTVFQGDYFEFQFQGKYDLIFSNPPYYLDTLLTDKDDLNQAKHTDQHDVSRLIKRINSILSDEGKFWVIIPFASFNLVTKIAEQSNLFPSVKVNIHAKPTKLNKRVVICFQRIKNHEIEISELVIRDNYNQYSSAYRTLTRDFHWDLF